MRTHAFLALALLAIPACVELDGQRITFRYLTEQDELQILLCYDGIHASNPDETPKAVTQLEGFVSGGDFMLIDWPFHFDLKEFRENLAKEGGYTPAQDAAVRQLLSSVKTTVLGHYRDPDGRIGAAQLVVISKASELLRAINAVISEAVLTGDVDADWVRTATRMLEGAGKKEQWLRFDGHSIVMSVPVHLPEWQRNKGAFISELLDKAREGDAEDSEALIVQLLAMAPMSLVETQGRATLRLGTASHPATYRFRLRDTEKVGLDEAVLKLVPGNLDARIAAALLDREEQPGDPALEALLTWGPPEEQVRALLTVAEGDDPEAAKRAGEKLAEFRARWNREVGLPEAAEGIEGLRDWYRQVLRFPAK
jgi:hypothetical protein